jgi:hypothetical protein
VLLHSINVKTDPIVDYSETQDLKKELKQDDVLFLVVFLYVYDLKHILLITL